MKALPCNADDRRSSGLRDWSPVSTNKLKIVELLTSRREKSEVKNDRKHRHQVVDSKKVVVVEVQKQGDLSRKGGCPRYSGWGPLFVSMRPE